MSEKENAYSFETLQIHAGQETPTLRPMHAPCLFT